MFRRIISLTASRCCAVSLARRSGTPLVFASRFASSGNYNTQTQQQDTEAPSHLHPPSFELPFWNDQDTKSGFMIRISYMDNCVVLQQIKQDPGSAQAPVDGGRRKRRGSQMASIFLPNIYIARILAVLDGTLPKCDFASRTSSGVISAGETPNTFRLDFKSTTGFGATISGLGKSYEWGFDLDPPSALMLQRFMMQALHYNNGFVR